MAAVDGVHQGAGRERIADARDRADPGGGELGGPRRERRIQAIVGEARADDHERTALVPRLDVGELALERDGATIEAGDACQRLHRDARRGEGPMNLRLLVAHDGPGGGVSGRCDVTDRVSAARQVFGKHAAHIVVIEVVHHDRVLRLRAGGDVVGSEDTGTREAAGGYLERRPQEPGPARARGDDNVGVAET
jgi:hypothetical protein